MPFQPLPEEYLDPDRIESFDQEIALLILSRGRSAAPMVERAAAREVGSTRGFPLTEINPRGGTRNCVNCALALDSTLGGSRASALLGQAVPLNQVPGVFGKAAFDGVSGSLSGVRSAFGSAGSRGVVVGTGPNGGHAFNVINERGVVKFLDGQSGLPVTTDGFTRFYYLRTGL
jgi:hypothetical protein